MDGQRRSKVPEDPDVIAHYHTHRARLLRWSCKPKDSVIQLVIEIPPDPTAATALLRIHDEDLLEVDIVRKLQPGEETPLLDFRAAPDGDEHDEDER